MDHELKVKLDLILTNQEADKEWQEALDTKLDELIERVNNLSKEGADYEVNTY